MFRRGQFNHYNHLNLCIIIICHLPSTCNFPLEYSMSHLIIRHLHTADGEGGLEVGKAQQWGPGTTGDKLHTARERREVSALCRSHKKTHISVYHCCHSIRMITEPLKRCIV